MDSHLKEKLASFGSAASKPSHASVLFPELAREINSAPTPALSSLSGLFIISVTKRGAQKEEWYILAQPGQGTVVSQQRPTLPAKKPAGEATPVVVIEVEDDDLLNIVAGGLSGLKAYLSGRMKIVGDMQLAFQLEEIFVKAGGVEKVLKFLKDHHIKLSAATKGGKKSKL
ncbi:hypothetical protein HK101_000744 [Irineochytrium annulatum]|nr:hypothetical protein HK101_000744 [Irineochytrium annulatum]